jgi:hypothetical protein
MMFPLFVLNPRALRFGNNTLFMHNRKRGKQNCRFLCGITADDSNFLREYVYNGQKERGANMKSRPVTKENRNVITLPCKK